MEIKLSAHSREILSKLGNSLKELRLNKELSLEDIHQELKIHPKEIRALEAGSIEDMASILLYLRSLKAYSKHLDYKEKSIEEILLGNHHLQELFGEYLSDTPLPQNLSKKKQEKKVKTIKTKIFTPNSKVSEKIKTVVVDRADCLDVNNL